MSNTAAASDKRPSKGRVTPLDDKPVNVGMLNTSLQRQKEELLDKLKEYRPELDEALKIARKHRGISKEVTRLHARWEALSKRLDSIDPNAAASNPYRAKFTEAELETIRHQMEAFDSFSDLLIDLQKKADKLEENQEVMVDQHNGLVGKHNRVADRVTNVETEVYAYRVPKAFYPVTIVLALIAGIIAAVWWSNTTFTSTIPLPGGTSVTYKNQLNEPFFLWVVGIGTAAAVILVMALVAVIIMQVNKRRSSDRPTSQDHAETYRLSDDGEIVPAEPSTPEDLAPTKPIPAEGATSGAR